MTYRVSVDAPIPAEQITDILSNELAHFRQWIRAEVSSDKTRNWIDVILAALCAYCDFSDEQLAHVIGTDGLDDLHRRVFQDSDEQEVGQAL